MIGWYPTVQSLVSPRRFNGHMCDMKGVPGHAGPHDPFDFASDPPPGWRHPVTGRYGWRPSPGLVRLGRHLRRGRYLSAKSQDTLSEECGVSQSQISRAERALAPGMSVDRLVMVGESLGHNFPLGYCPHGHSCPWQRLPDPPDPRDFVPRFPLLEDHWIDTRMESD